MEPLRDSGGRKEEEFKQTIHVVERKANHRVSFLGARPSQFVLKYTDTIKPCVYRSCFVSWFVPYRRISQHHHSSTCLDDNTEEGPDGTATTTTGRTW